MYVLLQTGTALRCHACAATRQHVWLPQTELKWQVYDWNAHCGNRTDTVLGNETPTLSTCWTCVTRPRPSWSPAVTFASTSWYLGALHAWYKSDLQDGNVMVCHSFRQAM
jgi:hypothetical protein